MNILLRLSQLFSKFLERRLIKIFKKKFHKFLENFQNIEKFLFFLHYAVCSLKMKNIKAIIN